MYIDDGVSESFRTESINIYIRLQQ